MTLEELRAKVDSAKASGLEHIILTSPRNRSPRSDKGVAWSGGPRCTYVGQLDNGRWLVDVLVVDVERWLAKTDSLA